MEGSTYDAADLLADSRSCRHFDSLRGGLNGYMCGVLESASSEKQTTEACRVLEGEAPGKAHHPHNLERLQNLLLVLENSQPT
jgi:hypothetical protein